MGSIKKSKLGYTTNQYMVLFVTSWCFKNFDRQGSVAKKDYIKDAILTPTFKLFGY